MAYSEMELTVPSICREREEREEREREREKEGCAHTTWSEEQQEEDISSFVFFTLSPLLPCPHEGWNYRWTVGKKYTVRRRGGGGGGICI